MGCTSSTDNKKAATATATAKAAAKAVPEALPVAEDKAKAVLHGHPLSQPCRSIQWYIAYAGKDVEVRDVDLMKGAQKAPEYVKKFPAGQVPAFEEGTFYLEESLAILSYIAGSDLKPVSQKDVILLDQYFGRHYAQVRKFSTKVIIPALLGDKETVPEGIETITPLLEDYNKLLGEQKFIVGDKLTLADFLFAPEVDQLQIMDILDKYPNILAYIKRLSEIKGYSEGWTKAKDIAEQLKASRQ
eukprot:TRINITY_DN488_c0_g4_i1.p1 TRINITY_DN488_c0_g4~~TRINITY_DN488_c0_g4_i1.p1  ORF type:complete len:244 (+),score=70.49 TRINITY_DN488_c0_g4_i1:87-818(+)